MLVVLTSACTSSSGASQEPDVVIAASLELTGSAAALGVAYERALRLEVDRVNESGTLSNRHVRLIVSDNRTESATALTQVTRFAANPDVSAIITGACTECAVAVSKTVEDRGIPMITLAPAAQPSMEEKATYVFKIGANSADNAAALAAELVRSKVERIALLVADDAYGKDGRAVMRDAMDKADITVVTTSDFHPGDTDLTTSVRAVTQSRTDAVVVWAFPAQATLAASALRQANYQGKLFFDASAAGDLFLTGDAAAADGATMVFVPTLAIDDVIATTPAKAERRQWFEDYTSRYGVYQGQSSFAADAVLLIVDAVAQAKSADRAAIRTKLEVMRTEGLSGPIRMTPSNHSGLMPQALTLLVAQSGRWRLLG
ncbi:MAG: ABC transporter substrate-binding protein [Dactylosporangium sp.]|nr:ABC transporter substrate-binding protein [Dactylosporangium sp.]NNJ60447.1 ABC transporter substrate-binding protein [Dactylosporangium sp.]